MVCTMPVEKPFDIIRTPLKGTHLIEAGAGTGKTYSITGLYLRLLLEKRLSPENILVVTFTQAATEELKDRIRKTLVLAKKEILGVLSDGGIVNAFLQRVPHPREAQMLVQNALNQFDRASIHTIHGFCQKVLLENAFETGSLFDTKLVSDRTRSVMTAADDFWRHQLYSAPLEFITFISDKVQGPAFLADLFNRCRVENLTVIPRIPGPVFQHLDSYRTLFQSLREAWIRHRDTICEMLIKTPSLSGTVYGSLKPDHKTPYRTRREVKIRALSDAMDRFMDSASVGFPMINAVKLFGASKLTASTKKQYSPPSHDFFTLCDTLWAEGTALTGEMETRLIYVKERFIDFAKDDLNNQKQIQNIHFYDDLLRRVGDALAGSSGGILKEKIRIQYAAALVDEFQDTDHTQHEIFADLFGEDVLFLIGDPKQSIYGFRGADIFTYLTAADRSDFRHTLVENWRSTPDLIHALNVLFSKQKNAFVFNGIRFREGISATTPMSDRQRGEHQVPALTLWYLDSRKHGSNGRPIAKAKAVQKISRAVAGEITRLISSGKDRATVAPGDVAVLVRTNRQAQQVKKDLSIRNVPTVLYQTENVFDTPEALELRQLLWSLSKPGNDAQFRVSLCTEIMGITGDELEAMEQDAAEWNRRIDAYHDYHRLWNRFGFFHMFQSLMSGEGIRERLIMLPDGDRRLTNLLHLADILSNVSVAEGLSIQSLLKWLDDQLDPATRTSEEETLRLESDENAVQIVTIHKSKGLEYPIVFCPFAWSGSIPRKTEPVFYDRSTDGGYILDLGSENLDVHNALAADELLAENVRLLYVALTRAKVRCYLAWGRINTGEASALSWLLHYEEKPKNYVVEHLLSTFTDKDDQALLADLTELADGSDGTITLVDLPEPDPTPFGMRRESEQALTCRVFDAVIGSTWSVSSYSSLTSSHSGEGDQPDHDAHTENTPMDKGKKDGPMYHDDIFAFPGGVKAGSFFHDVLEQIDFQRWGSDEYRSLIAEKLGTYGLAPQWLDTVCHTITRVLNTPLDQGSPGLTLSSVDLSSRVSEMAFYYPLKALSSKDLTDVLLEHGACRFSDRFPERMGKLSFQPKAGFMKGFIDLVFRSGNRFYLLDWKSNRLGEEIDAYDRRHLQDVMETGFYVLQYHLYALALDLFLKQRMPGYDYKEHFGGVYYVFIRGVDPKKGTGSGVYGDRPSKRMIDRLGTLLIPGYSAG